MQFSDQPLPLPAGTPCGVAPNLLIDRSIKARQSTHLTTIRRRLMTSCFEVPAGPCEQSSKHAPLSDKARAVFACWSLRAANGHNIAADNAKMSPRDQCEKMLVLGRLCPWPFSLSRLLRACARSNRLTTRRAGTRYSRGIPKWSLSLYGAAASLNHFGDHPRAQEGCLSVVGRSWPADVGGSRYWVRGYYH